MFCKGKKNALLSRPARVVLRRLQHPKHNPVPMAGASFFVGFISLLDFAKNIAINENREASANAIRTKIAFSSA